MRRRGTSALPIFALLAFFAATPAFSQIQQSWVRTYNNAIPSGNHQALKMALDTNGNIYITGFSQNTNGNLGYATIKYAPNGNKLWVARYDSTNNPSATPAALVLDTNANAIITGTAVTVKYDTNGNQLWTAPYAGTALALQSNVNPVVSGYGTAFNTVKLSPAGNNIWTTTYTDVGPTVGQAVAADTNGNVYVSGYDAYFVEEQVQSRQLTTIKHNPVGGRLWISRDNEYGPGDGAINVGGAMIDNAGNFVVTYNTTSGNILGYITDKYSVNGALMWKSSYYFARYSVYNDDVLGIVYGLVLDNLNNVLLTGQLQFQPPPYNVFTDTYGTFKLNTGGASVWTNSYPQPPTATSTGTAITVDSANNVYVTGYSSGTNSSNNIVTIKYDSNGNQIWLESYSGQNNGSAAANAIAVDANGNVYVTGYENVAGGGTEMVLIKYAPGPIIQRQSNGTIQLHTTGVPGQSFDFQASSNFVSWLDLGTTNADTNGCVLFTDTNAPLFP